MTKILVVDDSKVVRKFITGCLERLGFTELSEAANGLEALNQSKASMPDVVMLDWNMPVMDGLEYLKNLRVLPNGNHPIVIFCTTENEIGKITSAITSGANEYIMKPFDGEVIRTKFVQLGIMK